MFYYTLKYYIYMLMYIGRYLSYKKDYVILLMKHVIQILNILFEKRSIVEKILIFSIFFPLQWICTINNISKQIYLSENPEVIFLFYHIQVWLN